METKINIAELLKNCQSGMELDCTIFDDVYFDYIDDVSDIINCYIQDSTKKIGISFSKYGCYLSISKSKCVIFPKGKTTWDGFVPPCQFKDGDVLFHSDSASNGIFIFKEILQRGSIQKVICYCDYDSEDGFYLGENHTCCWTDSKILRPATKEQRDLLFQKMKEAGYKWNPETKTLEKLIEPKFKVGDKIEKCGYRFTIKEVREYHYLTKCGNLIAIANQDDFSLVPNKFDINTLIPFESRVLVRDFNDEEWCPAIWGVYGYGKEYPHIVVSGNKFIQCIPYEGNEHLLGKTDDCDRYYKTWK